MTSDFKIINGPLKGDFKELYPLHYEAINIIHHEAKFAPNSFEILKENTNTYASKESILISFNYLDKLSLKSFAGFVYPHELGHIKNTSSETTQKRGKLIEENYETVFKGFIFGGIPPTILSLLDTDITKTILSPFGGGLGLYCTTALTCFLKVGIKNYCNKTIKSDEHQQDLFAYNLANVLPSEFSKELKKFKTGFWPIENTPISNTLLSKFLNPYPTPNERDAYVIKHGDPKPNPRLLELFKLDEINRRNTLKK